MRSASTMADEFVLESAVRAVFMYTVRPGLLCWEKSSQQKESLVYNSEDPFAVRLKRGGETVRHVSHEISKICWLSID